MSKRQQPYIDTSHTRWLGDIASIGNKGELKYDAVEVRGKKYVVGDTVQLAAPPGVLPYLGRIAKLWEDPVTSERKCECAWYFRRGEIDKKVEEREADALDILPGEVRVLQACGSKWS